MDEITIKGGVYRIGRIDAWTQFHVSRRLTPLLTAMATAMGNAKAPLLPQPEDDSGAERLMQGVVAMANVLATMKDEDCDYVIRACLRVCHKKQGDLWTPVMSSSGTLMFSEVMGLSELLQLTSATLQRQEGLVDFFTNLQSQSVAPLPAAPAPNSVQ